MKSNLLKQTTLCIALLLGVFLQKISAQCMLVPVSLDQRLTQSSLVVEGIVQDERSLWDDNHQAIYTIHTVQLTNVFKGNPASATVEILSKGGTVGELNLDVTNQIKTWKGRAGVFTLMLTNAPVRTGKPLYECYAAVQGFIAYDPVDRSAAGVFDEYVSVENKLYPVLEAKLGSQRRSVGNFSWNKVAPHGNPTDTHKHDEAEETPAPDGTNGTMAISGFTPTSIAAGSQEILTINGSGFGSTQGTSYVQFRNANDGGSSWTTPASGEYLSWSDTQITLYVPTLAGTGQIRVVSSSTQTSSSSLTVTYNLTNVTGYNSTAYFQKLYNTNSSGGYTFTLNATDITTNPNTYFTRAVADWVCNSDINWRINSSTTTIDAVAYDNVSVVHFDALASGTLGVASVWRAPCSSNTSWVVLEVDMSFSSSASFYYGTGTPGGTQYDFYTVALHELGHAHLLGHVINSGTMMHYALSSGATGRTFSATQETAGAADVIAQCTASANCATSVLTASTLTACSQPTVTLSAGSTSIGENGGSTTLTATLSAAYIAPVTVTLSTSGTATSGTDYSISATTITIAAGSTTSSVTLTATNDAVFEGNETVIVAVSGVTNGTESGTQQQTVTITDDETGPSVSISSSFSVSTEGGSGLTITATQSATSSFSTTVNFSFSGTATYGTDYNMNSSITIPAGSTSATTSMVPVDDANDEATETIIIDVSSVTNGTENGTQQLTINLNDNDAAPSVTMNASANTIAEAAGVSTITATLSATSYQDVTVTLTATGTATGSGTDYTLGSSSIVITAGNLTGTTTVTAVQDTRDEDDETVILNITAVTNGTENGTQAQTITITDDDAAPTVTLSTGATSVAEAAGSTTVTATLSAVSGKTVTVTLSKSGTATDVTDYTLSSTTITIAAGNSSGSTTLTAVQDVMDEDDETVIIDINTVTNGTENGTQQRTVTITDDDAAPTVTLSTGATSIAETSGSTTITATLSAASSRTVTVTLALSGTTITATDYTLGTSITIAAGSTSGSITLSSVSDATDEYDETVIIDISSVTNGTESGTQQATVTITDDDAEPAVSLNISATSLAENNSGTLVIASIASASGKDITVNIALTGTATPLVDHTMGSTLALTIPAGSTNAADWVYTIDDVLDEDNETIIADITSVTNGTENGTQQDLVTITDDDATPTVTIAWSNSSIGEGPAGTSNAIATLSAASGRAVTINLNWSGTATLNTDYTVTGSTITIPAGSISGFVTMNNLTDNLYEISGGSSEYITVTMSSATNATIGNPSNATMTQNDDDPAPTVTLSSAGASISENGGTVTITVTQSAISGVATTITIARSGTATSDTDYTLSGTSITIPAGSTTATATITAINDAVTEGDETVILDISAVTNGTESGTQQVTVTLLESTLPVRFASFTAVNNQCKTNIAFSTAFEQNNNRFEVEWSVDGNHWNTIATIAAKGNSSTIQQYNTVHASPASGSNYYRIKQIDNNGSSSYSDIVNARSSCNIQSIKVTPNPFSTQFTISGISNGSTLLLMDAKGMMLMKKNDVNNVTAINTSQLANGTYVLVVTAEDGSRQSIKLVKE
jgi:hypothetical protein